MVPWKSHRGMARLCQILIFLEVTKIDIDNNTNLLIGKYALVHFINEDVFGDVPKKLCMVRHIQTSVLMTTAILFEDGQRKQI